MVEALRPKRGGGGFLRPFGLGMFIREYLLGRRTFLEGVLDEEGKPLRPADPRRGAPIEDIRAAYKTALLWAHAGDMVALALERGIELSQEEALGCIPHRLTNIRSHSFYRYFHHLKMLGWVEATGQEEVSLMGGSPAARVEKTQQGTTLVEVPQPRRFYRLTPAGRRAPDVAWSDPLEALYDYPREQRSRKKAERKLYKPSSLPRGPRPR